MVPDYSRQMNVVSGFYYMVLMPCSECAMHMKVADTVQQVYAIDNGVRLGGPSGPYMTDGEAGIYRAGGFRYCYGMQFPL